jgi:mycofactocin glycosyltransferase
MTVDQGRGLAPGARIVLDGRTRLWRGGGAALGGAPWGVVRISPAVADLIRRLATVGDAGLTPARDADRLAADLLVQRGLAHPLPPRPADLPTPPGIDPPALTPTPPAVQVVVPAFDRPELLDACLACLGTADVVVVDDASTSPEVARVAVLHGARLVRHPDNRGPAAARNSGLAATTAPVVAFLDADCLATPGWLQRLLPLFDDPRVAAVAPRVIPRSVGDGVLARHERSRSALDMGPHRALVRRGSPLGFLPSAALLVRRDALAGNGFDEDLRLGEDVDLVWRLADAGWQVRYEPDVVVHHEMRASYRAWAVRRYEYGTSAADLDRRHPGRLAPVRVSGWNAAALAALLAGRPGLAGATVSVATGALGARLRGGQVDPAIAAAVVGKGLLADAAATGHALRREWWPLGWLALAVAPRSRVGRACAAAMLAPVALEWWRQRPGLDPARYAALRLIEDAAYGTGVLVSAVRRRRPGVLLPDVRLPGRRRSVATPARTCACSACVVASMSSSGVSSP